MTWLPWIVGLFSMGVVFVLVPSVLALSGRWNLTHRGADLHHTHKAAVPRIGGIALAVAFTLAQLIIPLLFPDQTNPREKMVLIFSSLAIFGLGFWDDLRPLGARRKLLG